MINNTLIEVILFTTAVLNGFYAGTGFFIAIGGNPAIKRMSDRTFAEYWQHTDHFMAARMKIFGPLLLLSMLLCVTVLYLAFETMSFWCMVLALGILITDIVFTFSTNHPLNRHVQSWELNNLPVNVSLVKRKIVKAFSLRSAFMISSFVMMMLAIWLRKSGS